VEAKRAAKTQSDVTCFICVCLCLIVIIQF
jgi:hypothetical protein